MMAPLGLLLLLSQQPAPASPCDPITFRWRLDATDAELSQGDISYLAATAYDARGKFAGQFVLAGDPDAPILRFFIVNRHTQLTVSFCGGVDAP